jgi:hypothetical protein
VRATGALELGDGVGVGDGVGAGAEDDGAEGDGEALSSEPQEARVAAASETASRREAGHGARYNRANPGSMA